MGSLSGTNGPSGGSGKKKKKESLGWRDYVFVDLPLDQSEVEVFRVEYVEEEVELMRFVSGWAASGYKFSASSDPQGSGGLATLTCREPEDPNHGMILTARASSIEKAIKLLIYLDLVICADKTWKQAQTERGGGGGYMV